MLVMLFGISSVAFVLPMGSVHAQENKPIPLQAVVTIAELAAESAAEPEQAAPAEEATVEAESEQEPEREPEREPAAEPLAESAAEPKQAAPAEEATVEAEPEQEPEREPAAEPVAEPAAEPEQAAPAEEATVEAEPEQEPEREPAAEPVAEPAAEPEQAAPAEEAESEQEPEREPVAEPVAEPAAEPKQAPAQEAKPEDCWTSERETSVEKRLPAKASGFQHSWERVKKDASVAAKNVSKAKYANLHTSGKAEVNFGIVEEKLAPSLWYKVRLGESLWLIGKSLGVQWQKIMEFNKLVSTIIYPDQKLGIPDVSIGKDGTIEYRIKDKDTLYWIGQSLGVRYLEIMALNNLDDHLIYPEDILLIKIKGNQESLADLNFKGWQTLDLMGIEVTDDRDLLARAVYGEARGETFDGQVAVAAVILNRLANPNFPNSIRDIIYQPYAFTAVMDGQINLVPDKRAYEAVSKALQGEDPTEGALYYWNPEIATSKWIWTRPITKMIGNHVFAH